MGLPSIAAPTYELIVPSTKQKIKYRPFLVKEEKALLIAQQSENEQTMLDTINSIITSCTFGKVDVSILAMFDIEYIFIKLRSKSVGEISQLVFSCLKCNDPKAKMKVEIDLNQIEVEFDTTHTTDILLYNDVGIKMKYPSLSMMHKLKNLSDVDTVFSLIVDCIDFIYEDENIYTAADQTKQELEEFINNLTQEQFAKIENFFKTMPQLEKKIAFKCHVCGFDHTETIQGIEGFF